PTPARKPSPSAEDVYEFSVPSDAPALGTKRDPKVVMQVFSDFQCPACSRVVPLVEEVRKNHADEVKVVFRHYPLEMHKNAMQAHEASLEVLSQGGADKFWEYHDILFENQGELTVDNLARWADELGLDGDAVTKAIETHRHQPRIEEDKKVIDDTGVRVGTPMISVNGRLIRGVMEYSAFKNVLKRAMAE
ncbi:MAG: DsbA family protein, partial [Myxococcota bacterium]